MHSGATAHTGLSACFLINSPSPTFSIFLAFILYSHLYINLYTLYTLYIISYISYILYFSCIYLFYLFFSILRYLRTFSRPFSALSRPCRTPNLPHSPLSHRSITSRSFCNSLSSFHFFVKTYVKASVFSLERFLELCVHPFR